MSEQRKILGYCSCCGEPNIEGLPRVHDPECIWYEPSLEEVLVTDEMIRAFMAVYQDHSWEEGQVRLAVKAGLKAAIRVGKKV